MTQHATPDASRVQLTFAVRCLITLAILFLLSWLAHIPAPGIDISALASSTGYAPLDATAAMSSSVIALQVMPVYTALVIVEFFRFALPGMARWDEPDPKVRASHTRAMLILAFFFALIQGWGVASALEAVPTQTPLVPDPGDGFRFVFAITQLAGMAALIAIAGCITHLGIGSGLWVLIAASHLATLPLVLMEKHAQWAQGLLDPLSILAFAAAIGAGCVGLVLLFNKGLAEGRNTEDSARDLLLPLFIGMALGAFLYGLVVSGAAFVSGADMTIELLSQTTPVRLALTAGLIAFIARVRLKGNRTRGWEIAALSCALFVSLEILGAWLAHPTLLRADMLAILVITLALAWGQTPHASQPRVTP